MVKHFFVAKRFNGVIKINAICLLVFIGTVFSFSANAQFNRGTQMAFGKNRVQYIDFLWTFYRFKNFDTYFYVGGEELATYTGRTADSEIADIEKLFDYRINGRFQFVIYNKLSDLKQSNIGLEGDAQLTNTGGLTKIIGNKVLLYFDGDYRHFREQIRGGVAQVMINQLMYGGSIKDRLQSAVLLNLPEWYVQGLIEYVAKGWNFEQDNRMRDEILSRKFRKFNRLSGNEPGFAGHALWSYIVETYGVTSVSNLLYMTRINRNIESGFLYVLGVSSKQLTANFRDYYQRQYLDDDKDRSLPTVKPVYSSKKPNRILSQVKVSPDGTKVAFTTNELGKYRVFLYDSRRNKVKRIAKGGYKSISSATDNSFPVLAWHPTGRFLTVIKERKGKIWMDYLHTDKRRIKRETNKFFYFEKVLDFSYAANGQDMVLSGIQKGQSDIFSFNTRTKAYQQLTRDYWDDRNPRFVMNDKYIAFSSNRPDDTLRTSNYKASTFASIHGNTDIFLFDFVNKSPVLTRLTNTPNSNETQPMMTDSSHFSFLSDENGIINRYAATLDSTISFVDTTIHYRYIINTAAQSNYSRNLIQHDINYRSTRYAELFNTKGKNLIYLSGAPSVDLQTIPTLRNTRLRDKSVKVTSKKVAPPVENKPAPVAPPPANVKEDSTKTQNGKIDINNYQFQSEFPTKKKKVEEKPVIINSTTAPAKEMISDASVSEAPTPDTASYLMPKKRNYDIAFKANYVLTQLDNSLFNETYQAYNGSAVYFDPGLNILTKIGLNDLMEDYRITGGFRFSGDFNSNEYYASWENYKRRLDKQISFYRQGREEVFGFTYYKTHTHELKYTIKYPFNDLASLRGNIALRTDRLVALSTDNISLTRPNQYRYTQSIHAEYVYDNTISTGLNLYNGLRYKIFGEVFHFSESNNTMLEVVGMDFRLYTKVHRQIIWANRFAASSSFGGAKLLYYLGSTDNAITPTDIFDYSVRPDPSQTYAFQALATNMRGFIQNVRNGTSFALINSELRIPIFQYIFNRPIRSDLIRTFQLITFADVGTAWTGSNPYSKYNALYTNVYPGNPITITVTKNVEPVVAGYGFGLRGRVLGYFLRTDWAWGIDDKKVGDMIFYFSIGLDF